MKAYIESGFNKQAVITAGLLVAIEGEIVALNPSRAQRMQSDGKKYRTFQVAPFADFTWNLRPVFRVDKL